MNHSKIGAALHALADAFLEGAETVETAVTGGKKGKKVVAAEQPALAALPSAANATATQAAVDQVAAIAAVATGASLTPAASVALAVPAPASTITKDQLNKAVLKVAAKSRRVAEDILAKFGAQNTVTLPPEQWQAVYDAFEEELAKQDAAAVQVQQASLV
jgi:hypothetical protein